MNLVRLIVCFTASALCMDPALARQELRVGIFDQIELLHPYYYEGLTDAAIVNQLFPSLFRGQVVNTSGSVSTYSDAIGSIADPLHTQDNYREVHIDKQVYWRPGLNRRLSAEDVIYSFYLLSYNPNGRNTYTDKFVQDISVEAKSPSALNISLKQPLDNITLKEMLSFKLVPFDPKHPLVFYDTKARQLKEFDADTKDWVNEQHLLKVRDILRVLQNNQQIVRSPAKDHRFLIDTQKVAAFDKAYLTRLNAADVRYTWFVFKKLKQTADLNFGITKITPINQALAGIIDLKVNPTAQKVQDFLDLPLLMRPINENTPKTLAYWGTTDAAYRFVLSERKNKQLHLRKHKNWSQDPASQGNINLVRLLTLETRGEASLPDEFQKNRLHLIVNPPLGVTISAYDTKKTAGIHQEMIAMNCREQLQGARNRDNPLSDHRVRLAIHKLIDIQMFYRGNLPEGGTLMHSPLTAADERQYIDQEILAFDPQVAHALLKDANYQQKNGKWQKNGKVLSLQFVYPQEIGNRTKRIVESIAMLLRAQQIVVDLDSVPQADYEQVRRRGDWHLIYTRLYQSSSVDLDTYSRHYPGKNFMGFRHSDPEFEQKLEAYRTASGITSTDLKQELANMISRETPAIFLWDFNTTYVVDPFKLSIPPGRRPFAFDILGNIDDWKLKTE